MDLLQPGDQILSVNGEDVKKAPRDHVIKLVRACKDVVRLTVCQPPLDNVSFRRNSGVGSGSAQESRPERLTRTANNRGSNPGGISLIPLNSFSDF